MLHVHRSERADRLVDALAEVLRDPPADPFAAEVVAVPARGVERWLTQRLSHRLGTGGSDGAGVCANVRFPSPAALVAQTVASVTGTAADTDPWQPGRLLWQVLAVLDECAGEEWCATVGAHLGTGGAASGRRVTAARHLAGRYDAYGAARPQLVLDWAGGRDTDGAGAALTPDLAWQATLWRRVRDRIGTPSPAERLAPAAAAVRDDPGLLDLPERLSLFGPTRLTVAQLEVLAALAAGRDVHLWLPHPSPALWRRVADLPGPDGPTRRRLDPSRDLPRNPLLASLGRDAREVQMLLAPAAGGSTHHPVGAWPGTALGRLQAALAGDEQASEPPTDGAGRAVLQPGDRSVQVHACHGPERQVEVLRDVLVGLLAADPSLEPRDVLVMCPDIEDYAPLISATFGLADDSADQHPGHRLRVRLADRSVRRTNPLLGALSALLDLGQARVTASEVLDLAASGPVRRRFRFTDDDLERLQEWVARSGVRWSLDAAHRRPFGLSTVAQNTWRAGLDRILLGAAMAEDEERWVGLALPLDDVDSSDIDLAGRLAELVDRLTTVLDALAGDWPLAGWLEVFEQALEALTAVPDADGWQAAQVRHELARLGQDAADVTPSPVLALADVRALLADRLAGRPTRANFRTGNLTMCSMVPMRSVPHRVVCLLGLDDGRFPRSAGTDGDDVLRRDPCVGERDPRSEDRQLLLDAVLATREHLVILHTGADPRTNARRAPAVPVGEILDALDAVVRTPDGRSVRDHVVVRHPLQPFDRRNFTAGELGEPGPFSFDRQALKGAECTTRSRMAPGPFLPAPLPAPAGDLALADLVGFVEQPVRAFLRQRLGMTLLREEKEINDAMSVQLDGLEQWAVGDRLLSARLAGATPAGGLQAEWRRGALPPGELGKRLLDVVAAQVEPLVAASARCRSGDAGAVDVALDVAGRRVTGTVPDVYGSSVVRVVFSRLGANHRLRAWVQLLALSAGAPGPAWTAVTIGRGGGEKVLLSRLGPVEPGDAHDLLADLVDLWARGQREPLPLAAKTSAAYAQKRFAGRDADVARGWAGKEWVTGYGGEQTDPAHAVVWGESPALDVLLEERPRPDETGRGWPDDETTRFGVLARRLWEPVLGAERTEVL